jgi:hypothetical protein
MACRCHIVLGVGNQRRLLFQIAQTELVLKGGAQVVERAEIGLVLVLLIGLSSKDDIWNMEQHCKWRSGQVYYSAEV